MQRLLMQTVLLVMWLIPLAVMARGTEAARPTEIKWHGHAAFEIRTPEGNVLLIDPWLNNPRNPNAKDWTDPVKGLTRVDYILLTHGHFDHIGDAVKIAGSTGARLVATPELGTNMAKINGYPRKQMGFDTLMNIGGTIKLAEGEITISMTAAVHSSGMPNPKAGPNAPDVVYGGNPVGFIIKIRRGPVIYHTGDTAYFSDMRLIGGQYRPDLALINIGGHFGMEPVEAARAAHAVRARWVVPHHFGTFPILTGNPGKFRNLLRRKGIRSIIMVPGETIRFQGKRLMLRK